jgi:hypothetical protein
VGVVPYRSAGMASGINTTFRQVGVATGIAVFGTLFATRLTDGVLNGLRGTSLAGQAHGLATALTQGQAGRVLGSLPPATRGTAVHVARAAFVSGLNEILLVAGIGALVAAVAAFALIRGRDFVVQAAPASPPAASPEPGTVYAEDR